MNTITLKQLKKHEACTGQLHLFKELFGNEVEVTVEKCIEYYNKFNWTWAAKHLLSDELFKEYKKIKQLAWEGYEKIEQPAWEKYEEIGQPAYKEYLKIQQLAQEEYSKKTAQAFGECYLKMEEPK